MFSTLNFLKIQLAKKLKFSVPACLCNCLYPFQFLYKVTDFHEK